MSGERRFLFIGDTIVPVDGSWKYWVSAPNRPEMRRTIETLAALRFDVILSNSFAATPTGWLEAPLQYRDARMDAMQREAENSEDFKEATRSFVEKRKPVVQGR